MIHPIQLSEAIISSHVGCVKLCERRIGSGDFDLACHMLKSQITIRNAYHTPQNRSSSMPGAFGTRDSARTKFSVARNFAHSSGGALASGLLGFCCEACAAHARLFSSR